MHKSFELLLVACLGALALACSDSETTIGSGGGGSGADAGGMGGGTGGSGATGGAPGGMGGSGGTSSGGTGGSGGTSSGGMGGMPPTHPGVLVDDGLVVRYYMDEATTGQTPTELIDAAPTPLNLPIAYIPEMQYAQAAPGMTGIAWEGAELQGVPSASTNGTKLVTALHTSTTATLEMVLEYTAVSSSNSRLLFIGVGSNTGRFTFSASRINHLRLYVNEGRVAESLVNVVSLGRFVVHAVYDSTQADEAERARIYVNGGRLPSIDMTPAALDAAITFPGNENIGIGNRAAPDLDRSIQGTIYYTAIYDVPLTDQDIVQNALLLTVNDDTPTQ